HAWRRTTPCGGGGGEPLHGGRRGTRGRIVAVRAPRRVRLPAARRGAVVLLRALRGGARARSGGGGAGPGHGATPRRGRGHGLAVPSAGDGGGRGMTSEHRCPQCGGSNYDCEYVDIGVGMQQVTPRGCYDCFYVEGEVVETDRSKWG